MNRNQAKEMLPIIQAHAEGKTIQSRYIKGDTSLWYDDEDPSFDDDDLEYRIKPEQKYRPFANAEECWKEMQKHQPFGWVIKHNDGKILISEVPSGGVVLHNQRGSMFGFDEANRILTFADGTSFGVKVEE